MPLVAAKCPSCGAPLTVDSSKDAAICEYCGSPFIVEKAITNINFNGTTNVSVESAVININGGNPTINNLLKRAEQFELQKQYSKALNYYERVLDLDNSNSKASLAIDRINNSPILEFPIAFDFVKSTLILTRTQLIHKTKRKITTYPIKTILSVERLYARINIELSTSKIPLSFAIGNKNNAKLLEDEINNLLSERRPY